MSRKVLKFGSILMVMVMIFSVMVGCGARPSEPSNTNEVEKQEESDSTQDVTDNTNNFVTEEKVTISYLMKDHSTKPISEDNPVLAELQKRTNVYFEFNKTADGYNDKFKITLASGKLPDLLYCGLEDSKKYGPEGAFMPLDDLLEEFGPNILKTIEERGLDKDLRAIDGKIYALPKIREMILGNSYILRQDWMDQLNLESPDTLEDFYNVLKAFKEEDPAGDGNTIPLGVYKFSGINSLMYAFGVGTDFMVKDGEYVFGSADPGMKDALVYLNKLYSEGLMDPEFAILSKKQWEEKVASGKVGAVIHHPTRTEVFTGMLRPSFPDAKMEAIAPLTGPDGKKHVKPGSLIGNVAVLSKDTKNAEVIIKMFDYAFSDEGKLLMSYGIEGDSYVMKDGKPEYTDKMYTDDNMTKYAMFGRKIPVDPLDSIQSQLFKGTLSQDAMDLQAPHMGEQLPNLNFTEEEMDILKSKQTELKDKAEEYIYKVIMGKESIDNWEAYIQELEEIGLDELEQVYNEAYARYNQ